MGAMLPITVPGMPTVLIGSLPAARMTDLCACIAPIPVPVDPIVFGSPTVLIGGLPAARMFDPTAKGGLIMTGFPTVLIGLMATPAPGEPGSLDIWEEVLADGTTVTHVGDNITITGSQSFRDATARDLQRLDATPTGHDLIARLNGAGRQPVTIVATTGGNEVNTTNDALLRPDGSAGPGAATTLQYNPDRVQIGDGSKPYMTRPPAVGLAHELVHCEQAQDGGWSPRQPGVVPAHENSAVGVPPYENNPHTENKVRSELGQPTRTEY
jgi:uncharacterized Zn-binding protein involved in type VI secretion